MWFRNINSFRPTKSRCPTNEAAPAPETSVEEDSDKLEIELEREIDAMLIDGNQNEDGQRRQAVKDRWGECYLYIFLIIYI